MEQKRYLIDSNAMIDYLGATFPASGMDFMHNVIDDTPIISVITKIEVLSFNAPEQHYKLLIDFIQDSAILALSNEIVETCIKIRKAYKTKLPDAIIAATAIVNNQVLITRNSSDFKNIVGLQTLNPHSL